MEREEKIKSIADNISLKTKENLKKKKILSIEKLAIKNKEEIKNTKEDLKKKILYIEKLASSDKEVNINDLKKLGIDSDKFSRIGHKHKIEPQALKIIKNRINKYKEELSYSIKEIAELSKDKTDLEELKKYTEKLNDITNKEIDKVAENINKDIYHNRLKQLNWKDAGHVMDTDLNMKGNSIRNLSKPTQPSDATNKGYVDSLAQIAAGNGGRGGGGGVAWGRITGFVSDQTDLQNELDSLQAQITAEDIWDRAGVTIVPHTANDNIDIGTGTITAGTLIDGTASITGGNASTLGYDLASNTLTGTKAEFDIACSDGAFAFSGGAFHDGFSDFVGNEHIDHTGVTLTAGTGLTGGGDISANRTFDVNVGITDNDIVQIDDAGVADDEYARFTATGLEGRTYADIRTDINVADGADVTGNNAPKAHKDSHDPNDGGDALDTANAVEIVGVQAAGTGTSHSFARADHAHQIQHSIANNHLVTVDDADAADNDFVKFTALGLEGRSYSETLGDLSGEATGAFSFNDQNIINVGDISLDSISSDAGTSINVDLGGDAGDDFTVDTSKLVVEGDTGRVGIGTTAPDYKLEVDSSVDNPALQKWTAYEGEAEYNLALDYEKNNNVFDFSSGTRNVAFTGTGNVGIGTTAPASKLEVNGGVNIGGTGAIADDDLYVTDNCSALSFTDRTPFYEGDALTEIKNIKGKDGKIDHTTLPSFAQKELTMGVKTDEKIVEEVRVERDLGAMISVLTVAVQQLTTRIETLELNK